MKWPQGWYGSMLLCLSKKKKKKKKNVINSERRHERYDDVAFQEQIGKTIVKT